MTKKRKAFLILVFSYFPSCFLLDRILAALGAVISKPFYQSENPLYDFLWILFSFDVPAAVFYSLLFGVLFYVLWVLSGEKRSQYLTKRTVGIIFAAGAAYHTAFRFINIIMGWLYKIFDHLRSVGIYESDVYYKYFFMALDPVSKLALLLLTMFALWKLIFDLPDKISALLHDFFWSTAGRFALVIVAALTLCSDYNGSYLFGNIMFSNFWRNASILALFTAFSRTYSSKVPNN